MIYNDILETIGGTPIVRINRLAPDGVEMYVKIEAFNPMGSVKDRLALGIILDAEKKGLLKPGQTVIEATSGNTGIALAMVCAVRGYPFVSVIVVLTPAAERATGMVRVTEALAAKHGWFMTQQFENQANPAYHANTTGPEILQDFANRRLDYYVSGYGTGGTITGAGHMIRLARPEVTIVSTEPAGAALLEGNPWQPHKIQGWTPDFLPAVLDREVAHQNIPVTDEEAIATACALAVNEGIFCGISAGGTFAAALKVAENAEAGSVILAMLPDTGERYLTTPLFESIPDGPDEAQELLEGLDG
jgi:cysteine synthase A